MSSSDEGGNSPSNSQKRYKGVRRRKWGKWVSEIRVPGTQERLWLGSYVAPEAAAVAHDIAYYCLRERTCTNDFNFPLMLPAGVERGMSPSSVQKAATDAGMAIDARFMSQRNQNGVNSGQEQLGGQWQSINSLSNENSVYSGQEGGGEWQGSKNNFALASCSWQKNEYRELGDDALNISVEDYLH